jgi:hypothetical protein
MSPQGNGTGWESCHRVAGTPTGAGSRVGESEGRSRRSEARPIPSKPLSCGHDHNPLPTDRKRQASAADYQSDQRRENRRSGAVTQEFPCVQGAGAEMEVEDQEQLFFLSTIARTSVAYPSTVGGSHRPYNPSRAAAVRDGRSITPPQRQHGEKAIDGFPSFRDETPVPRATRRCRRLVAHHDRDDVAGFDGRTRRRRGPAPWLSPAGR